MLYRNFLFLLLGLNQVALAHGREENPCPKPEKFRQKIYNCGENRLAESYAKACAKDSLDTVRSVGIAVDEVMKELQEKSSSQEKATLDALSRLDLAIDSLGAQIPFLQKRTSLIASYVSAMIDYPGAENDEESMDCFSEHFHEIQKVVDGLDKEILRLKGAYQKAERLAMEVSKNHSSLQSIQKSWKKSSPQNQMDSSPSSSKPKGKRIRSSDITGTEDLPKTSDQ